MNFCRARAFYLLVGTSGLHLLRTIIAQAANKHDMKPRSISVKGVIQPLILFQGEHDAAFCLYLDEQILDAIAAHQVADRPDNTAFGGDVFHNAIASVLMVEVLPSSLNQFR